MQIAVLGSVMVLCGACGSTPQPVVDADEPPSIDATEIGSGSVVGTVKGATIVIADAVSAIQSGSGRSVAVIFMSSRAGVCADARATNLQANTNVVALQLGTGTLAASSTGVYPIASPGSGNFAVVASSQSDATCRPIMSTIAKATTGTVTVDTITGLAYSGSFDVMLDSDDHVTGTFAAAACPAITAPVSMLGCN